MIGWMARLLDDAPDADLARFLGPEYTGSVRRLGWTSLMLIVSMLMAAILWYAGGYMPATQYLKVSPQQKPQPVRALMTPVITAPRIQQWASRALVETMTFDFTNVDARLARASQYFSLAAYQSMRTAIENDGVIETIKSNRLVTSLTPISPPRITKAPFIMNGIRYWEVEVPVIITYTGASEVQVRGMKISMRIKEAPTIEVPEGMQITGFLPVPYSLN